MSGHIDFYFDFSSPYGYLASKRIDALAAKHGRTVNWRPHLIGAICDRCPDQSPNLLFGHPFREVLREDRGLGVLYVCKLSPTRGAHLLGRVFTLFDTPRQDLDNRIVIDLVSEVHLLVADIGEDGR